MSDWFKFHNDGLDEPRFQFAISEQPLVTSAWLLILSEASKKRSGVITWRDADFELIGFARKVNLSPPVFNQCVELLERIGYIKREDGKLTIPGWDCLQSDYAKGLQKGYYKKTSKILASVSEVSTVRGEEKRGEESREEDNKDKQVASLLTHRFSKPSIESVKLQCSKIGLAETEADRFFNFYESNGWRVGKNPMRSWPHALANWKLNVKNYANNKSNPTVNKRNVGCYEPDDYGAAAVRKLARQDLERQMAAAGHATPPQAPGA